MKFTLLKTCLLSSVMLSLPVHALAQNADAPRQCEAAERTTPSLYIWDARDLAASKAMVKAGDRAVKPALEALTKAADAALQSGPFSVTDKTKTPPSGSKQDYYSIGPYWWPNPRKKSGLPYVRRDGETNPERNDDSFDSVRLSGFTNAVNDLSLASYFTDNPDYGAKAAVLLRAWFINPTTRMNPNMDFAQAIPGKVDGRGIGIIDSYRFVKVVDSIGLLYAQGALRDEELEALKSWFGQYALWMITSDNGKEERLATNNHGIYYDVQLATFAAFSGDRKAVDFVINGVKRSRIKGQVDTKGRLPQELKRTRPFHYTAYTTQAFFDIADLAECYGQDLWNYTLPKGQGIRSMIDFHAGYAGRHDVWPYKEIRSINPRGLYRNLRRAARAYDAPEFSRAARVYDDKYREDVSVLLYPDR